MKNSPFISLSKSTWEEAKKLGLSKREHSPKGICVKDGAPRVIFYGKECPFEPDHTNTCKRCFTLHVTMHRKYSSAKGDKK